MTGFTAEDDGGSSIRSDDSLRFLPAQVGDTEELELYRRGGFHPVHLGDLYDSGRYRIVHKLGAGGLSTVWLAYDSSLSNWVALKFVVADKSRDVEAKAALCHSTMPEPDDGTFVTYIRYFHTDGPNGHHLCLVLPFLGPSSYVLSHYMWSRIRPWLIRRVASQAAKIIAELHSRGVCHGDITPSNLLFRACNLDHLDDQGIYHLFGEPKTGRLETFAGDIPGPEAPRYIVGYLDFMRSEEDVLLDEVCLIDFDQAFLASVPPKETLGIPAGFLAPEVAVGSPAGPASDVWALGCTILHLRSGSSPFATLDVDCPGTLIRTLIAYMGDIPKAWGEPLFDDDGNPTTDADQGEPLEEITPKTTSLRRWISETWDEPPDLDALLSSSAPLSFVHDNNKPYPKCYEGKFWKPAAIRIDSIYLAGYNEEIDKIVERLPKMSTHELDLLDDLLSKILVYEPSQRPSASDILAHPWFHMDD